jgi:hypothetical protein
MTTVINTPGGPQDNSGSVGWMIAVVVLVAVAGVGAFFLLREEAVPTIVTTVPNVTNNSTTTNSSTNINVTVPQGTSTTP